MAHASNDPAKRRHAISAWVWITKGLLVRNHPSSTAFAEQLFDLFNDVDSEVAWDAARAVGEIGSADDTLTKRNHAIIRVTLGSLPNLHELANFRVSDALGAEVLQSDPPKSHRRLSKSSRYCPADGSWSLSHPTFTQIANCKLHTLSHWRLSSSLCPSPHTQIECLRCPLRYITCPWLELTRVVQLLPLLIRGLDLPDPHIRASVIDTLYASASATSKDSKTPEQGAVSEHASTLVSAMLKNARVKENPSVVRIVSSFNQRDVN